MHDDLRDAIETAKATRDALLKGDVDVKTANAVSNHNHTIVTAHAVSLRERIFVAESEAQIARIEGRASDSGIEDAALPQ